MNQITTREHGVGSSLETKGDGPRCRFCVHSEVGTLTSIVELSLLIWLYCISFEGLSCFLFCDRMNSLWVFGLCVVFRYLKCKSYKLRRIGRNSSIANFFYVPTVQYFFLNTYTKYVHRVHFLLFIFFFGNFWKFYWTIIKANSKVSEDE